GLSRWHACRDCGLLSGTPAPADERCEHRPNMPSWRPGLSRWHACRDCGLLSGTPDPAEAGTPDYCAYKRNHTDL
ncbi:MAG: hypothetical protein ACLFVO_14220, partial [Chloroflexaceae bacterium]